jgi:hypothetical protein
MWGFTVRIELPNALIAGISVLFDLGENLEFAPFQEFKIMRASLPTHDKQDLERRCADDELSFDGMSFLFAGIKLALLLGRTFHWLFRNIQDNRLKLPVE